LHLTFYEEKSKFSWTYETFFEEANTAQIQDSFLKSFLGSDYDQSIYKADASLRQD